MPPPSPRPCTGPTCGAKILDVQCKRRDGRLSNMVIDVDPVPAGEIPASGRGMFRFIDDDVIEHARKGEKGPFFRTHHVTCPDVEDFR